MNKIAELIKASHATGGEPLFKGDIAGHEFHGNQYTDGGGGAAASGGKPNAPGDKIRVKEARTAGGRSYDVIVREHLKGNKYRGEISSGPMVGLVVVGEKINQEKLAASEAYSGEVHA